MVRSLENFPDPATFKITFLAHPVAVCVKFSKPLIRVEIGFEIGEMHVVVAVCQQRVMDGCENPRLIAAQVIGRDQIQCSSRSWLIIKIPSA
jgi:hypothetical protein